MKTTAAHAFDIVTGENLVQRLGLDAEVQTTRIFGFDIVNSPMHAVADHLISRAFLRHSTTVSFVNAHCVNVARSDTAYRSALTASELCLPDGIGMDIAARWHGRPLAANLNGTDLFPELCSRAATLGLGIFMLGGLPGVASAASAWARRRFPGLSVRGTQHGYFDEAETDAIIARINASGADMLFVGMGVPMQEKWIARHRRRITVPVVLGVGGLFDYYSGRIPRAPALVRSLRSEWVWRLAMEPRRMARRYLVGNLTFLAHAALTALGARGVGRSLDAFAKRTLDVVVASLAIAFLAPLLLATMLAIRLEDCGPALFRQTRIGADGRPFTMLKLRSMFVDAEARKQALLAQSDRSGASFKMLHDPRITRVGQFIRRFSIDELPQLFNVLGGSMSLVGPRPALPSEVVTYRNRVWERLRGKPGITCTWQVSGRADIPFPRQALMDRAYLRRRNFMTDLTLLARTLPAVAGGRGAY